MSSTSSELAETVLRSLRDLGSLESELPFSAANIVIGTCTQAEVYVDRLIRRLIQRSSLHDVPLGRMLLATYGSEFTKSWTARLDCLSKGFEITVKGSTVGQRMNTLVQLRNSLAHGDGYLTDLQTAKLKQQLELERALTKDLDVTATARRLTLGAKTASYAVSIARDFILDIDDKVMTRNADLNLTPRW